MVDRPGDCVAKNTDNPFDDDLFEPFDLEDEPEVLPAPQPSRPAPQTASYVPDPGVPTVRCQSCGTTNPAHNRHCEECGARLGKGPLPVAPPPMPRSTPGGRALGVLGGVVLLVALIALFMNIWGGNGDGPEASDDAASTTATIDDSVAQVAIAPASVEGSSQLEGYEAARLIDGDVATYWNDQSARGVGAELVFVFAQPVALSEMELSNISDRGPFRQNYRIKDIEVTVDDLELQLTFTVPDSMDPYRITLDTLRTTRLTLRVLSTYPGEPVGDSPAFDELGLAEVRFFGTFAE